MQTELKKNQDVCDSFVNLWLNYNEKYSSSLNFNNRNEFYEQILYAINTIEIELQKGIYQVNETGFVWEYLHGTENKTEVCI